MSQKFIKVQNKNMRSTAFGKYFARAVYDKNPISTKDIANFIQVQASIKKSDCLAVLDELGAALKHYLELGQKVKIDGIGIFKVGFSSIGAETEAGVSANNIYGKRVIFTPETVRIEGQPESRSQEDGSYKVVRPFTVEKVMVSDVVFEEARQQEVTTNEEGGE
ncbi:MAG: DNA-binding protein [Prevotella sp.]|nr:DNA-binding protein [Prevotella sp.]